eukprot:gene6094-9166_t
MKRFICLLGFAVVILPSLLSQARAENGLATPLPTGDYFGAVSIVPYTRSSSGYICTTCSPVKAQARILFLQNSMIFNISSASSGSCSLFTQGYYFYNLQPFSTTSYPFYYVGNVQVGSAVIPMCMYFDNYGTFRIKLDGQGSCPASTDPASCKNGQQVGTVSQTWSGSFQSSNVPSGNFFGNIAIVPYTRASQGYYTCTNCAPIISGVTFAWNGDSFIVSINGKSTAGCSLLSQTYKVYQVVEYGPNYPGYFSGYITVEGYTIPICFYWDRFGYVVLFLDGQGTCPNTSDKPSCTNGWVSGTVSQTWRASVTPTKVAHLTTHP